MLVDFGQRLGGVSQFAYVVEDLERNATALSVQLGIGPWFVRSRFCPPEGRYRGVPTKPIFSLARGFSGHAMLELIQQHDETPSVYHDGDGPRRYGFHHFAIITDQFDADLAKYLERGYGEAYSDRLPSGSRVMYLDSSHELPGMLELIEYTAEQERTYARMYTAALTWDGSDPVRFENR